jgi:integrase
MMTRHSNDGVRKICACSRRQWGRCKHPWHISYKYGDIHYRASLKRLLGHDIETKDDAKAELDKIRTAIRKERPANTDELRMMLRGVSPKAPQTKAEDITLEAFGRRYVERVSQVRERSKSWRDDQYMTQELAAFELDVVRLGDKPLAAVSGDDLELFMQNLRQKGRAASTRNHYVQLITSMFRWATKKGYLDRNPITEGTDLKRTRIARRHRRLEGDEEERLLASAHPRLQRLIVAAIESGCRQGELLALTWADVSLERGWIHVRAKNAKSDKFREIPISARFRSVLEMARHDPAGRAFGPHHYPFGNEIGQRTASPKKMWAKPSGRPGSAT